MAERTRTGGREATTGVIPGRIALSVGNPRTATPEGFRWAALSDVARLESGHTPSRSKTEYWDGDIPWIGVRDATANHGNVLMSTNERVTQAGVDNSSTRVLPAGTVCLSRTASVGYVVTMGRPMATSQDFVNWVCGDALNPMYLHYVLMLEQESIRRFAHGTTHQTMYYPEAKALHIMLPDRPRQDAVVDVLGTLDDKMAANHRVVQASLDLAHAWFSAALARSERQVHLGDVAVFHNKCRVPLSSREREAMPGSVPYYGAAGVVDYVGSHLFDDVLVLVGEDGTVASPGGSPVVQYVWGPAWVNNHAHVLTGAGISTGILRLALERSTVVPWITGAVQPKLSMGNLRRLLLVLPDETQLAPLTDLVESLLGLTRAHEDESARLARMRDVLLPLLMSGKVRVKDAEKVVEGVV